MPTTLAMLLAEFMKQHAEENLAPKTVERYLEMAAYLAPDLLALNMTEITPLHLSRERTRLLKSGGHTRKSKAVTQMWSTQTRMRAPGRRAFFSWFS